MNGWPPLVVGVTDGSDAGSAADDDEVISTAGGEAALEVERHKNELNPLEYRRQMEDVIPAQLRPSIAAAHEQMARTAKEARLEQEEAARDDRERRGAPQPTGGRRTKKPPLVTGGLLPMPHDDGASDVGASAAAAPSQWGYAFPNARHSPVVNSAVQRNALCDLRRAVHIGATARETHAAAEQPYDSDATEVIPSDDEYACAIFDDAQKVSDERRARSRYWASESFSITRIKLIQLYSAQARADELRVTPEQKADLVLAKYGQTMKATEILIEKIEGKYGGKDGAEPPAKRQRGDSDAPHPMAIPTVPRTPMPSARCVVS